MNPYNSIIEQIWKENKNSFRSKKEIETYLFRYFAVTNKCFDYSLPIDFAGIGKLTLTGNGKESKKKVEAYKDKLHSKKMKKYFNSVNMRYIDISFQD